MQSLSFHWALNTTRITAFCPSFTSCPQPNLIWTMRVDRQAKEFFQDISQSQTKSETAGFCLLTHSFEQCFHALVFVITDNTGSASTSEGGETHRPGGNPSARGWGRRRRESVCRATSRTRSHACANHCAPTRTQ